MMQVNGEKGGPVGHPDNQAQHKRRMEDRGDQHAQQVYGTPPVNRGGQQLGVGGGAGGNLVGIMPVSSSQGSIGAGPPQGNPAAMMGGQGGD